MKRSFVFTVACILLSSLHAGLTADFSVEAGRIRPALHSAGFAPRIDPRARPGVEEGELKPLGLFGARTHDWARVNKGQRIVDTQFIFPLMHLDAKDPKNYFFKATDEVLGAFFGDRPLGFRGQAPERCGFL